MCVVLGKSSGLHWEAAPSLFHRQDIAILQVCHSYLVYRQASYVLALWPDNAESAHIKVQLSIWSALC